MLTDGFFTAVGTPYHKNGCIHKESLAMHIENQIRMGASGIFLMGTMGIGPCITESQYIDAIKTATDTVKKRVPLWVGVMDNSIGRVCNRIDRSAQYGVDGVVLTAPFYFTTGDDGLKTFFRQIIAFTKLPVYLYDQPLTKHKINYQMIASLSDLENFAGIKSDDLPMMRKLVRYPVKAGFTPVFSGLDVCDAAYQIGISHYLDGMFSLMPQNTSKMQKCFALDNFTEGAVYLDNILNVRDLMIGEGIWGSFTYAMNLLGFEGCFAPDYEMDISPASREKIKACLEKVGEL